MHFLGFSLRKREEGEGVEVRLSARTRQRLDQKIRELTPRNWGRSLEECMARVSRYVKGWVGYFRLCSHEYAEYWFRRYDAHIRRRIRAIIIVQKKRPRHLYRHLIALGARPKSAMKSAWRGGPWHRSHTAGVNTAYRNAWFHARMESLWFNWLKFNPPANAIEVSTGQLRLPGMEMER